MKEGHRRTLGKVDGLNDDYCEAMVLMAEVVLENNNQEMEKGKAVRQGSGMWVYKSASCCSWCI